MIRWNQNAGENVDLLSDAVAHLFSVANNIRAAVAADLYDSFISPFMKVFVAMEDDSITYELLQSDETLHSVLHQVKVRTFSADFSCFNNVITLAVHVQDC